MLDHTVTPMGARLLRQWLLAPLTDAAAIAARLDAVGTLVADEARRAALREALDGVRDLERLGAKAAARRATPRDLGALRDSLAAAAAAWPQLREPVRPRRGLRRARRPRGDASPRRSWTARPPALGDGDTIRPGARARSSTSCARCATAAASYIASLQARERARTGIGSLKVGYNKVFGYYIEVTQAPTRTPCPPTTSAARR